MKNEIKVLKKTEKVCVKEEGQILSEEKKENNHEIISKLWNRNKNLLDRMKNYLS